jgi:hypothetical protein
MKRDRGAHIKGDRMGYYISFMFDPSKEKFNREKLIAKFLEVGAWEEASWFGPGKDYFYNWHLLSFGECTPEALENGYYADARFSWGSEPEELVQGLTELLDLADRLGCRLYDGQLDIWITRENVESIAEGFTRSASSILKLFGTVDKQRYVSELEALQDEKSRQHDA